MTLKLYSLDLFAMNKITLYIHVKSHFRLNLNSLLCNNKHMLSVRSIIRTIMNLKLYSLYLFTIKKITLKTHLTTTVSLFLWNPKWCQLRGFLVFFFLISRHLTPIINIKILANGLHALLRVHVHVK